MSKTKKNFAGVNILEVWDYRLSTAKPDIYNSGKTWRVEINSKSGDINEPLEVHDTGILVEHGDAYDSEKIKKCFEWLLTVRDKYALPNIEELKPKVALFNFAIDIMGIALTNLPNTSGARLLQKPALALLHPNNDSLDVELFFSLFCKVFTMAKMEGDPDLSANGAIAMHETLLDGIKEELSVLANKAYGEAA